MDELSDVVLVVGEEKFYVSKLFLSSHSSYLNTYLRVACGESKKEEVELINVNSDDFQHFLEVLHGEDAIDMKRSTEFLISRTSMMRRLLKEDVSNF